MPTSAAAAASTAGAAVAPDAAAAGQAPTRSEFLVVPAGAAKAGAVRIVRTDETAPTVTSSLPGAASGTAAPAAAPTAVTTAPAPAAPPVPVPLAAQVAKPLFTLSGAKAGEHVLTINVTPENLGPLTVRAHVTGDNIRVELFAPTDLARDALRAILPDLRRDLAGSTLNAQLDVSSQNSSGDPRASDAGRGRDQRPPPGRPPGSDGDEPPPHPPRSSSSTSSSTIDVMA